MVGTTCVRISLIPFPVISMCVLLSDFTSEAFLLQINCFDGSNWRPKQPSISSHSFYDNTSQLKDASCIDILRVDGSIAYVIWCATHITFKSIYCPLSIECVVSSFLIRHSALECQFSIRLYHRNAHISLFVVCVASAESASAMSIGLPPASEWTNVKMRMCSNMFGDGERPANGPNAVKMTDLIFDDIRSWWLKWSHPLTVCSFTDKRTFGPVVSCIFIAWNR